MKRIFFIALSTIGLGGTLFAFIKKTRRQRNESTPDAAENTGKERQAGRTQRRTSALGMSVKRDGSLNIRSEGRKKPVRQHESERVIHLKKDGSPDKRYKENRSEE